EETGFQSQLWDGNREWIILMGCVCADGSGISPNLTHQTVSGNIQDTWLQGFSPSEHKCNFISSPSGWTNNDPGYKWLVSVFDKEMKTKRLLTPGGHGSHVTVKFIDYCNRNRILPAIFPPDSTHTVYSLDVSLFSPRAIAYSDEIEKFLSKFWAALSTVRNTYKRKPSILDLS
ncbi:hypothetical protein K469DRAFT_608846, partial [Zopfia rhizophila CBS 207.26]